MSTGNNKYIALCLPAILDLNLIKTTTQTIKKNIIDANPNFNFNVFVNIDNYRRPDGQGTQHDVAKCYEELAGENCNVDIAIQPERLGMNLSYMQLMKKFIKSESQFCMYFDDDHEIINPIKFDDFFHLLGANKSSIFHLATAKKEIDKHFSYENPFLENVVLEEFESTRVYKNNRVFHTLPGTIFSKQQALVIFSQLDVGKTGVMIEDMVAKTSFYKTCSVFTIFFKSGEMKYDKPPPGAREGWILPLENHFAYDRIRASSEYNGANMKDYNIQGI